MIRVRIKKNVKRKLMSKRKVLRRVEKMMRRRKKKMMRVEMRKIMMMRMKMMLRRRRKKMMMMRKKRMMMREKSMKMVMRAERTSHRCTRSALPSVPAIRQIPPGNRDYGDYNFDDGYWLL